MKNAFGYILLGYLLAIVMMIGILFIGFPEIITIIMLHMIPPPML